MAKTIVTQFGEFLNYDNLVRIGIITNWEDAEVDQESGTITPDYEMIGTDTAGNQIPMGIYATPDEAEAVLKDLHDWLSMEAYTAYIALIFAMYPEDEWNFETLIDMINNSECREDDEEFKNSIDLEFEIVECWLNGTKHDDPDVMEDYADLFETKPDAEQRRLGAFALKQFKAYKLAAGKTAKSILISCSTRLAPFAIDEVLEITSYDELHLDKLGDELSALFIIISDTDATFNFLVAIMYSQLFNLLCTKADNSEGGKLNYHVRCLLDEFANSVTRSVLKRYGT